MSAKYIKQEISDLNGTGRTQAYYKMKLRPLTNEQFISICADGSPLTALVVDYCIYNDFSEPCVGLLLQYFHVFREDFC